MKKKQIMIVLLATVTMQLIAMEEPSKYTKIGNMYEDFIQAAQNGEYDRVNEFIKMGARLNAANRSGETALQMAAFSGHIGICYLLIQNGANVNIPNRGGITALMYAAGRGHTQVCKILLENGAAINAKSNDLSRELTALMVAAEVGRDQTCKFLIENGADVYSIAWSTEHTALDLASQNGHENTVRVLLTTIPLQERIKILETKRALTLSYTLATHKGIVTPPRDIRGLISQELINKFTQDQMHHIERLIAMQTTFHETAYNIALRSNHPAIAQILNLSIPESRRWIQSQIAANVLHIFLVD
jgi:hypothetical protein